MATRGGRSSRDIGSKPIAGIVKLDVINVAQRDARVAHFTALAQGQSARLITWRSSDQNPQAVFYNLVVLKKRFVIDE